MAKLYFRYSAMNAGKSTSLLQVAHNYEEQGAFVRLFTAAIDDRFGVGQITSRLGPNRIVELFHPETDFIGLIIENRLLPGPLKPACVLVDESQFLTPDQVRQLHQVAQVHGVPVICYGLRSDFRGEPFPGSTYLLALADDLEEIKNICSCGKKATMNVRIDELGRRVTEGEQISIGGNESYVQKCARCFYTGQPEASFEEPGHCGVSESGSSPPESREVEAQHSP